MSAAPLILVAAESGAVGELVAKLLREEFRNVVASFQPQRAIRDFEDNQPAVLVLAFSSLAQAEDYYLGLYRLSGVIQDLPHRTIILCNQRDLPRVYTLCRRDYFDDYVLFWPMPQDAFRLRMAVHQALRCPAKVSDSAELGRPADAAWCGAGHGAPRHPATTEFPGQAEGMQGESQAEAVVLLVDDEAFQHSLIGSMLRDSRFRLQSAHSADHVREILRTTRPDVLLMDINLPGTSGIAITREIKAQPELAAMPVIMITGQGNKTAVLESQNAGAAGFLVKPVDRNTLLSRLEEALEKRQ